MSSSGNTGNQSTTTLTGKEEIASELGFGREQELGAQKAISPTQAQLCQQLCTGASGTSDGNAENG